MRCGYCEWRCDLAAGAGVCGMYELQNGAVKERWPFTWTRCQQQEMEKIPIFHFLPGERVLQLGGWNCNAKCAYCMNANLALPDRDIVTFSLSAKQIVARAARGQYRAIHFGVNEPAMFLPSALEVARAAREADILCGISTNGFLTPEAAEQAAEAFSFCNLSLKSLRDDFYRQHLGLPSVQPILRNLRLLDSRLHLEVTTPVTRETLSELPEIAAFLQEAAPRAVWHLFRLLPANEMEAEQPPAVQALVEAVQELTLRPKWIYISNFVGSQWASTLCPECGETLIERLCEGSCGARFLRRNDHAGRCPACGAVPEIRWDV